MIKKEQDRFDGLLEIQNRILSNKGDVQDIFKIIVSEYSVMPQADGIAVELLDGDQLFYAAASGASAAMLGLRIDLQNSLSGSSLLSGELLLCRDSESDPRVNRATCQQFGLRSMIVVPIPHAGRTVGVLKYHSATPKAFRDRDMFIAQLLVGPIAIGMSNVGEVDAIQARNELREIVRLKEELICTVSHELRTPLTSIFGSLRLLESEVAGKLPDKAMALVGISLRSAKRLTLLVNDLLDMGALDSGNMHFELEMVDLCYVVQEAVLQNRDYARQTGVTLDYTPPDASILLMTDQNRIIQVLNNLISNAAKFSPEGSVVFVCLDLMGDYVRMRVADQGPGIPNNFRHRLFNRFSQSHETNIQSSIAGTGLGLSITKAIVERLGGTIQLDTTYNQGAAFDVMLPLLRSSTTSGTSASESGSTKL